VKEKDSVGRPPADPRHIAICLIIKVVFGLSYRSVYSLLSGCRDYREVCRVKRVPGYNTVQGHVRDVGEGYLDGIVRLTSSRIMKAQGRSSCNSACDGTGISTKKYERWLSVRKQGKGAKKRFIKLHAHTTTDSEMPFFLSAKVTKGYKHDSPQLKHPIRARSDDIGLDGVSLDSAFLSRRGGMHNS
jgi:hypothetical protein